MIAFLLLLALFLFFDVPTAREILAKACNHTARKTGGKQGLHEIAKTYTIREVLRENDERLPRCLFDQFEKFCKAGDKDISTTWDLACSAWPFAAQSLINARHEVLLNYRKKLWELLQAGKSEDAYLLLCALSKCKYASYVIPNVYSLKRDLGKKLYPGKNKRN